MSSAGRFASTDGIALVVALMASVVLLGVVGVLVPLATTEVTIAAHHRRAVEGLYAAEAALAWTVGELAPAPAWRAALAGRRSGLWAGAPEFRLADGSRILLDQRTAALRRDGAGPGRAGRGLPWSLFGHGTLDGLMPLPAGYGEWRVAVWLASEPGSSNGDVAEPGRALAVHAAAFDAGLGHRAVQADLVRLVPPLPAEDAAAGFVQVLSWRIVR
ncbi:MAG: hypothetical protein OXH04_22940 [Acidobacteria bacterium]|nr:hypothetical protein [Acidobacteriota bacterium]